MIMDGVNKETGEIVKPYETPEHLSIKKIIEDQISYVNRTLKDKDGEKISSLSGDMLSIALMELTAMYETLGGWLANEKLHVADLKSSLDLKFANAYVEYKSQEGETNETARMKSKIECAEDQSLLDRHKHGWDVIDAWKKSVGRYHDAVRSQLSWEKSLSQMNRG